MKQAKEVMTRRVQFGDACTCGRVVSKGHVDDVSSCTERFSERVT